MNVYGELTRAQLENLASAPTPALKGRLWWRSDVTGGAAEFDNGSLVSRVLLNNQTCVIGTSGTAAQNVRLYRSGIGKLALTLASDGTAEGTASGTYAQLAHALEQYTTGTRPTPNSQAIGQMILNTTDMTIEIQDGTSWFRQFNGGTASNTQRLILPGASLSTLNALTRKTGAIVFATDALKAYVDNGTSLVAIGSGSGGSQNYILNPDFETGVSGWATYLNTAQSTPVTGTGGSPTVTFLQTLSGPLRGTASGLLTKGASNVQGQGFSYDFTIDVADQAKVLNVSFDYQASSLLVVGPTSDVQVFIYDKTNSVLIPVAPQMLQGSGSNIYKFTGIFQSANNSVSYRLIFHIATVNASAYTLEVDNVVVGPQIQLYGAPISDETQYTAVFGAGFGSVATQSVWYRRVGSNLEIRATWTNGTTANATPSISLPPGLVVSSNVSSNAIVGKLVQQNIVTGTFDFSVVVNGGDTALFFSEQSTNTGLTKTTNGSSIFATGQIGGLFASVPIQGWSSTVLMSNDTDTRVVAMVAHKSTGTMAGSATTVATWDAALFSDTHAAFNRSTGVYTVPVTGYYNLRAMITSSAVSNNLAGIFRKNSVGFITNQSAGSAAIASTIQVIGKIFCLAGDTLDLQVTNFSGAVNFNTDATTNYFEITRDTGPSAIAATETVSCSYYNSSSPTVNSSLSTQIFNTKLFDTHGAYNTSTGTWTCPVSGKYQVTSYISTNTVSVSGVNNLQGSLLKNGSAVFNPYFPTVTSSALNTAPALSWTYTLQLLAGDTLVYQVSNSNSTTLASGQTSSSFIVTRIGSY